MSKTAGVESELTRTGMWGAKVKSGSDKKWSQRDLRKYKTIFFEHFVKTIEKGALYKATKSYPD